MKTAGARPRFQWLSLLVLVICLCSAAPAGAAGEYRTVEVESLKITIDSDWGMRTAPGYYPVRFDITNLGEARAIEIVGQSNRFFMSPRPGSGGGVNVRQSVRLARGDRVRLTIPVPVFADSENIHFELREEGRTLERFNYGGFQSRSPADDAAALIVADPGSGLGKVSAGLPRRMVPTASSFAARIAPSGAVLGSTMAGGPGALPPLDFVLEPSRLPTNWLGFTSLRAVVIGAQEWEQLNDAQKEALRTWIACGGDLLFVDGELGALFPAGQSPPAVVPEAMAVAYFFGRIHLTTAASISARGLKETLVTAAALQDSNWGLPANRARDWGAIVARGFRLLIPGVDGVPARAYLAILVVFSILIGPVNYWFFRRIRRQVLLVLTAPIISALFILVLAAYVLGGEGVGVRGRAVSFTMLDQVRKQAVTRASMSLYAAGTTPAGGLRFPRDVAVFPIGSDGGGSREQLALDLTESQQFTSGVIRARTPTNLEQIGFRPARERLSFSREAAGMSVTNGLGATVATLLYHDGRDLYQLTAPIPAGGKAVLEGGARGGSFVVPADLPQKARFQYFFDNPPGGAYLAVLDSSPFWHPGVAGVAERGSFHLVLGYPGGQP